MLHEKFQGRHISQMTLDEITELIVGMDETARREGIKDLEGVLPEGDPQDNLFRDGLQWAIEGFEPPLLAQILAKRKQTYLQQLETRLDMIIDGVMSIQAGDNPLITELKMTSRFDLDFE
jgi:flagellar motor component MotA